MRTGLFYLQTAKRAEVQELRCLAATSLLVRAASLTIHHLQRERGLSSMVVGSGGQKAATDLLAQIQRSNAAEEQLHHAFDQIDVAGQRPGSAARLCSRMAYALQGLQALPFLRQQVQGLQWTAPRVASAYCRVIAGLLAVVFEAADTASDPDISRLLVGMFHFTQGKEWAGQERAAGSAMFAAGQAQPGNQQRLLQLVAAQERCFLIFEDFANTTAVQAWHQTQTHAVTAQLERLRRVLSTPTSHGALNPETSTSWFDTCSERMDRMKAVEDALAEHLEGLCRQKLGQAEQELQRLLTHAEPADSLHFFDDPLHTPMQPPGADALPAEPLDSRLGRSVLELAHAQALRLQAVTEELDQVRASLNERKTIERAKGLLMAQSSLSEDDAHKVLRQMAMNQGKRLVEVASHVCAVSDSLKTALR
jgi:hypothetical protein